MNLSVGSDDGDDPKGSADGLHQHVYGTAVAVRSTDPPTRLASWFHVYAGNYAETNDALGFELRYVPLNGPLLRMRYLPTDFGSLNNKRL